MVEGRDGRIDEDDIGMTLEGRAGMRLSDLVKEIAQREATNLDASILGYAAAQAHAISERGERPEDYIMYITQERDMEAGSMRYTMRFTLHMEKKHDI